LVVEQIRVAQGEALSIKETPKAQGHAIEFRMSESKWLDTNDPVRTPVSTRTPLPNGASNKLNTPKAKLIVIGPTREVAIARAKRALKQFKIEGVASVLDFHRAVLLDTNDPVRTPVSTRTPLPNGASNKLNTPKAGIKPRAGSSALIVEHPVTEETSKVDLVVEQIRVAQGEALSIKETPKAYTVTKRRFK
jgi:acetyl-CoA/propionyl-CoA carboxylase biotin carboxyl carrier protein